ncbi:MAG: branched-chain amino acid ABC transporter permease, partial [Longimicrobiales bacterium]
MTPARLKGLGLTALAAGALVAPLVITDMYVLGVIVSAYITAIAVYGLNVLVGYTGQLSLAHAGFFGIGGYTAGLLMLDGMTFWIALPIAVALTCAIGFVVGMIALRTRGSYFAVFTLALGVIITIVLERWHSVTGGTDGLIGIPPPAPVAGISFSTLQAQYYLMLAFLALTIYASAALASSLVGRSFVAVRQSEDLARAIGIDVGRTMRLSFVVSAGLAALAGVLYATYLGYIGPGMSSLAMTFRMLLFLMLGGAGSLAGPLLGTLLISGAMQALQTFEQFQLLLLGPLLVVIMIV